MTAPDSRYPPVLDRPACTPSAIRAVLAANADAAVLRRYDAELDAAYEQARDDGDLTALVQTVRCWWFEADAWRDPEASANSWPVSSAIKEKAPHPLRNASAERRYARSTASEAVYRWKLDDLAQPVFDALGPVTQALPGFAGDLGVQSDSSAGVLDGQ